MGKKMIYTEEAIRNIFSKDNEYTLHSIFKKNGVRYMEITHNVCGKTYSPRIDKFFNENQRCTCLRKRKDALIKNTNDYSRIINKIHNNEYTVESEYIGRSSPITLKHSCGYTYTIKAAEYLLDERGGGKCPICTPGSLNDNEIIRMKLKKVDPNIELLEDYKGVNEKHLFLNKKCGHQYYSTISQILSSNGSRCPECGNHSQSINIDRVREEVSAFNLKLLSTKYTGTHDHLKVKCLKCGNTFNISRTNALAGKGCPRCARQESKGESEVYDFISSIYSGKIQKRKKFKVSLRKYKEIDIYLPKLKTGIEYNGIYWHSDTFVDKFYHKEKLDFFKSKGIRLIQIFEDEWLFKQDIVKSKLANILHLSDSIKIYGRNIIIKEIDNSQKREFLDKYHIQGSDSSNIKLGGFAGDELVAVMTFSKLRESLGSKHRVAGEFELSRFATSANIIGGFSKMLKYAITNYNITYIKTFADLRWSSEESNVYLKNGFTMSHISDPNYFYSKYKVRLHRYNYRKSVLKEKLPDFYDPKLTEKEIMNNAGFYRIWDCGNIVYELKL